MLTDHREALCYSLQSSLKLLKRLVDDLKPSDFHHQPFTEVNSIAWILGHLTLVDRRMLTALKVELPELPAGFEEKFQTTGTSASRQSDLGDGQELLHRFISHRELLLQQVPSATDDQLRQAMASRTGLFADLCEALLFLGIHTSMHSGQISLIRRSLGYPPIA